MASQPPLFRPKLLKPNLISGLLQLITGPMLVKPATLKPIGPKQPQTSRKGLSQSHHHEATKLGL